MPDFLVSAATGALKSVLEKLAALLGDEYKRSKEVRGGVEFLIRELEAMHTFLLEKSKEENPGAQDKEWMREVRELSYDIEDSLDEFIVHIDEEPAKPDGYGFIDKFKNLLVKTKARRRIAKEIQELKAQVKEVSERNARYRSNGTVMNTSNKVAVDPRALAIFEDATRLVGIDQPKNELISFLRKVDGCVSTQQTKMVSIVGVGGIGKTTLANQVYEELKELFECRAFLSVSRNPDMIKIFRTILSQVTGQSYYQTKAGSIQQLIIEINGFLHKKRYLVIIDDVWDVETWKTIKCALSNDNFGSAIVTTTRRHDVAKACCSLYLGWVYQPKPLQDHDSKRLFHNRIFGPGNECPKNLTEVSDKILKKCGGLPLAIIAVSALLANKARNGVHLVTEWDQVQVSIGHGLERVDSVQGMMSILSLSFFDLPCHLKACLLYLSIFPEDYEIEKDRLVRIWVAEGFISAEPTCTLYESGEKSFNELINRNLIIPKKINRMTGEVDNCRVHDTILDFIVCKSTEENFVTVHGIPILTPPPGIKVRRLSLQGKTEGDANLHYNQNYANVRSIIGFQTPCLLLGFRFLRVIDFTMCWILEDHHIINIGELVQLRYLGLRRTLITKLPEQIGELKHLETLDLRDCEIIRLPTTITRLKRLVNLLMHSSIWLNDFNGGIKNLQALQVLNIVIDITIHIKAPAICVEEIGELTKMRDLSIALIFHSDIDEAICMEFIKKMVSSIQRLNKLQALNVKFRKFSDSGNECIIFHGDDIMLEMPWCSASLRKLVSKISPMSRVPIWMESLLNIEELKLSLQKFDQEDLCILGGLPVLLVLNLDIVTKVQDISSADKDRLLVSHSCGYRSLRSLKLLAHSSTRHFSVPMFMFEVGSMPKLEELVIDFDADITISETNECLDFGLQHLSQLKEFQCHIFGTTENAKCVQDAIEKTLDNHPKRPTFRKRQRMPRRPFDLL